MIKRIFYTMLVVATIIGFASCHKKSVIPDDTLADIFHDAFVVNAYIGEERINLDSLQIYEPIFEKYGYTANDVIYTVGNFSRRKSARLGTVVEQAISRLEQEQKYYFNRVVILDTIRNVAVRTFSRTVHKDSLIKVKKRADSTKLQLVISPVSRGEYTISYSYKCEGDLGKYPRKAEFYFEDSEGFRSGYASASLNMFGNIKRTIIARGTESKIVLNLGKFDKSKAHSSRKKGTKSSKSSTKEQTFTIRDLEIKYKPTSESAIDSLFARYVDVKIFADGFLIKKDSLALPADSTRVSTPTTRND